jgi:hypothetical protein
LHVSDLPAGHYDILTEPSATVCTVVAPRIEEEPVAPAAAAPEEAAEPELIRKPKEEEGEGEETEE